MRIVPITTRNPKLATGLILSFCWTITMTVVAAGALAVPGEGAPAPSAWTIVDDTSEPLSPGVLLRRVRAQPPAGSATLSPLELRLVTVERALLGPGSMLALQPDSPPISPQTVEAGSLPSASSTSASSPSTSASPALAAPSSEPPTSGPIVPTSPAGSGPANPSPRLLAALITDGTAEAHVGTRVRDGRLLWMQKGLPALGLTATGAPLLGVPLPYVTVTPLRVGGAATTSFEIQAVNCSFAQQLTLFTGVYGPSTGTPPGTTEVILSPVASGTATASEPSPSLRDPLTLPLTQPVELVVAARRQSGNSPIPAGGAVLAVPPALVGPLLDSLVNGRLVRVDTRLNGSWQDSRGVVYWQQAAQVLPAQALLLGAGYINPQLSSDPDALRPGHQLVVALARDQLILAESLSPVSLLDLAYFLQSSLGASWAAALPATGRSLYAAPAAFPADRYRLLALWNTAPPSATPALLQIAAPATRILAGSRVHLELSAYDARGETIPLLPGSVDWQVVAGTGSRIVELSATGAVVQVGDPGSLLVRAIVSGQGLPVTRTWQAEVLPAAALSSLVVRPQQLLLQPGQKAPPLEVYGQDAAGHSVWVDPRLLVWSGPASLGRALPEGSGWEAGSSPATGLLQIGLVSRPSLQARVSVAIGGPPSPVDTFQAEPPAWRLLSQRVTSTMVLLRSDRPSLPAGDRQPAASPPAAPVEGGSGWLSPAAGPDRVGPRLLGVTVNRQPGASDAAAYLQPAGARPLIEARSRVVGIWVYGPHPLPTLSAELWDSVGRRHVVSFAPAATPGLPGEAAAEAPFTWQYLVARLPEGDSVHPPLSIGRLTIQPQADGPVSLVFGLLEQWELAPPDLAAAMASNPEARSSPAVSPAPSEPISARIDSANGNVIAPAQFSAGSFSLPAPTRNLRLAIVGSPGPPAGKNVTEQVYQTSWRIWERLLAEYQKSRLPHTTATGDENDFADLLVVVTGPASTADEDDAGRLETSRILNKVHSSLEMSKTPYLLFAGMGQEQTPGSTIVGPACLDVGDTRLIFLDDRGGRLDKSEPEQWQWLAGQLRPTPGIHRYLIFSHEAISSFSPPEQERLRQLLVAASRTQIEALPAPAFWLISGEAGAFSAQQEPGGDVVFLNSGGGGQPLRVSPEQGGYYHWLEVILPAGQRGTWMVHPLLERLTVIGCPETLPVGSSVQLTAIGDGYAGGAAPLRVPIQYPIAYRWQVSDPSKATIDPLSGELTALAPGPLTVSLDIGDLHWESRLDVVTAGQQGSVGPG
ncbi:MAG: hypothetical protein IMX01_00445 [Limnochordaceae bacterium]|nr:hypothetical protein [Limnochordaceae bacterium]